MDIIKSLLDIGRMLSDKNDNKYKDHYRSLSKVDGYININFSDYGETFKVDIQFIEMPQSLINEHIFYMKLPSGGNPYSTSANFRQLLGRDRKESTCFYTLGSGLQEGSKFKDFLLKVAELWETKEFVFPEDWSNDLDEFLKSRYGSKIDTGIQSAIFYNNELIMSDEDCQIFYMSNKIKTSKVEGECIYCKSTEDLITGGSSHWKLYTTTRKTQISELDNMRCVKCDQFILKAQNIVDTKRLFIGDDTFIHFIPITNNNEQLKFFYSEFNNKGSEYESYSDIRRLFLEFDLSKIKKIYKIVAKNSRQKTFEISNTEYINIDISKISKVKENEIFITKFIERHGISKYFKGFSNLHPNLWTKEKTDPIRRKLENEIKNWLFGNFKMPFSLLSNYLRIQENIRNEMHGNMVVYELTYLLNKGVDIVSFVESKEYAIGCLLNFAIVEEKKVSGQSQLELRFKRIPNNLDTILDAVIHSLNRNNFNMSMFNRKVVEYASKNISKEPLPKEQQLVAFFAGRMAYNPYPNYLDREEYFSKFKEEDQEEAVTDLF